MHASARAQTALVPASPRPPRLASATLRVSAIGGDLRDAMWRVFERYYVDVTRERFETDLAGKDHAIILTDARGEVRGFSTLQLLRDTVDGRRVVAVYSGDTVVDRECWGQTALHRAFTRYLVRARLLNPRARFYWFLISKGYKTYLLLARNFTSFWPRHSVQAPGDERRVLDALASGKFGAAYDPSLGILRFDERLGRVRPGVAPIDRPLLDDPDVRFFLERNPGHAEGDELCCLARLDHLACARIFAVALGKTVSRWVRAVRP